MRRFLGIVVCLGAAACGSSETSEPSQGVDPARALLGGDTTVFDTGANAFGHSARNLTDPNRERFVVGNSFFRQNWVTAPASTEARDGLGPLFNSRSCSGCHAEDGRGQPPEPGLPMSSMLARLSVPGKDGPAPEPTYGGQLQPLGILGVAAEGQATVEYQETPGEYPDGTPYALLEPTYTFFDLGYGPMRDDVMVSPRVAPSMIGLGLLEALAADDLQARADPEDADGDGISGRVNHLDVGGGKSLPGRFGWKANQPSLRAQCAGALLGDMGITSSVNPAQSCSDPETDCAAAPSGGEPEIDDATLDDLVLYSSTLGVPARRDLEDATALAGEQLFEAAGCASCHLPELHTASFDAIPELSGQTIRPFTDLLLHDLGSGLADDRPDGEASGSEWRTAPLWGIGLQQTVSGHTRLLHDGRARDAEEAILWHAGEAEASRDAFAALSSEEREALLVFLEHL